MQRDFLDTLGLIRPAAYNSAFWSNVMDAIATAMGAHGAALFPLPPKPNFPCSGSLERTRDRTTNGVATESDRVVPNEIAPYAFYRRFLSGRGLRWFAGANVSAGEELWYLSIQRTMCQGPFSSGEKKALVTFSRNLVDAIGLTKVVQTARAEGALAAFEIGTTAVALFDGRGELWRVNRFAEALFGPELKVVNSQLISAHQNATAELDRALSVLLWTGAAANGHIIQFPRKNRRPILAYPLRLPTIRSDAFSPCQAAVILIDLEKRARPSEGDLRACFGLTAAEAHLAIQINNRESISAICDNNRVKRETVRAQLKSVFSKTHTHRQAELVSLLSNFMPLVQPELVAATEIPQGAMDNAGTPSAPQLRGAVSKE